MKLKFYYIMMNICWLLEDIVDFINEDNHFYPSSKWEDLYREEKYNDKRHSK